MTIRFASFNLFQFVAPPFSWYIKKDKFNEEEWEIKTSWIKEQIKEINCDVIGFQEVFSKNELEKLCKDLGFKYFLTVDEAKIHKTNKNVYTSTTVALASKYPILETTKVQVHGKSIIKHGFKGHFKFSRTPIKALIELPNKQNITVYINHFKSNRLNEFEYIFNKSHTLEQKKEQTREALEKDFSKSLKQRLCETSSLYYDFKKTSTPIVFMCDLNDKEYSLAIEALTNKEYHEKVRENRKNKSYLLYDAYYLHDKKIYNPHPEQKEIKRTPTSYYQGYGNVLDYIFVSKELKKISSYEIFDKHLQENPHGSLLQSDHAIVVCEIKFE